ncbi:DUF7169 domain-containing protein [Protaetiibacter larvae]|uniref:Uncharacterized protein n=1 Tax=Protaetiibacter larvae TaxID=2592654 RepID=A0A5C1Y9F7_9MICO|nr:hypothetical protein [Protaetiibacter larvae]QEO10564.1 hypothetical protein FLP23_11465 [Protaetiibacter larvae]
MTDETGAFEPFMAAGLRLRGLLADAAEPQWMAGATPVPREDTTERSRGMVNDPVPTAAADKRRLELRAAVIEAERVLRGADAALAQAVGSLEAAQTRWLSEATEPSDDG